MAAFASDVLPPSDAAEASAPPSPKRKLFLLFAQANNGKQKAIAAREVDLSFTGPVFAEIPKGARAEQRGPFCAAFVAMDALFPRKGASRGPCAEVA